MGNFYDQGLFEIFLNVATNGIANFQIIRFLERFKIKLSPAQQIQNLFWSFDSTKYKIALKGLKLSREKFLSRLMSGRIDLENLEIQFPASMQEEK